MSVVNGFIIYNDEQEKSLPCLLVRLV